MRNKIFVFLLMVAVAGFMIGLDYDQAHARADAGVGSCPWASQGAHTWAFCRNGDNPPPCHDPYQPPSMCFSRSENANGTWVESWAYTYGTAVGYALVVADSSEVQPGDWLWGKEGKDLVGYLMDSIRVEVDTTGLPGTLTRRVIADMRFYPSQWALSWFQFRLKAGNSDQSIMCFDYYGSFTASGFRITGSPPISWSSYISNDTLYVTIDDTDPVACNISPENLCVLLQKMEFMRNTPTITQWGAIILVGLIVASGVFIMLRRRKAAVPA